MSDAHSHDGGRQRSARHPGTAQDDDRATNDDRTTTDDRTMADDRTATGARATEDRTTAGSDDSSVPEAAGERWLSVEDVRDVYAEHADRMERMAPLNRLLTGRARRRLFGSARGRVLDVACGTGLNRRYLPDDVEYVGVDLSPAMLRAAEQRHEGLERGEELLEMDAQNLALPDDGFDAVISSLSTCTFPDPVAALHEMGRVCAPDGRILLLEHGRSDVGPLARVQDWRADAHYASEGCRWDQEPAALVAATDLRVESVTTGALGILVAIEARPPEA